MAGKRRKKTSYHLQVNPEEAARYGMKPVANETRTLSPNEAGRLLGMTGEAVKQWIYRRQLPAVKLPNGFWRVKVDDLERFLKHRAASERRNLLAFGLEGKQGAGLKEAIEDKGHALHHANVYADALLKAADIVPALFLINVSKPDGWKLLEKVRKSSRSRIQPVLLFASHQLSESDTERAVNLQAQCCLPLPVDSGRLAQEIDSCFKRIG